MGCVNPTGIPGGMHKSRILGGIPGGIIFDSQAGMAGSHLGWRDPAIPTWDPVWDWWDPTWIPPDILPGFPHTADTGSSEDSVNTQPFFTINQLATLHALLF